MKNLENYIEDLTIIDWCTVNRIPIDDREQVINNMKGACPIIFKLMIFTPFSPLMTKPRIISRDYLEIDASHKDYVNYTVVYDGDRYLVRCDALGNPLTVLRNEEEEPIFFIDYIYSRNGAEVKEIYDYKSEVRIYLNIEAA